MNIRAWIAGSVCADEARIPALPDSPEIPFAGDLDRWDAFEEDHPGTFVAMYRFWAVQN